MTEAINLDKAKEVAKDEGLTRTLAELVVQSQYDQWPEDAIVVAKQCVLDLIGVTLPGASEPLSQILRAEAEDEGGNAKAGLVGQSGRVNCRQAALINGAAGHALDYDDVHWAMLGHPSVPLLPAVLAVAEDVGASGEDILNAFIAGYETQCRVGRAVGGGHYQRGWHGTGTIGVFGATAASARLMNLTAEQTAQAFGIAGTQASGLKSMFGTMCKPYHAGHAASIGVGAARLAARGFTSRSDVLETEQGFADARGDKINLDHAFEEPEHGTYVRGNLFKYHAACYLTHSSLEATKHLRDKEQVKPEMIESVRLKVDPGHFKVCNILEPQTGLEAKFSLRLTNAMAFHGLDTADIATFSDANANRDDLNQHRDKVTVEEWTDRTSNNAVEVVVKLKDGQEVSRIHDVAIAADNLDEQWQSLESKFTSLAKPVLGENKAGAFIGACHELERTTARDLVALTAA